MSLARFLAPIVDFVFPPRCPLCGDPVGTHGGLCPACWGQIEVPTGTCCKFCQRPMGEAHGAESEMICAVCMMERPRHAGIAAATLYNAPSRALVLTLKHGRRIGVVPMMARMMLQRVLPLDGHWLVVPVPLHRWRLLQRGFNQSALLAREIARLSGQELVVDALVRHRATQPLGGLSRKARALALSGAIMAHPRRAVRLKGAHVLLVDDVMTSGATTDACIAALCKAGAANVRIACFARVLDESLRGGRDIAIVAG